MAEDPLILLLAGELRMRGGTAYALRLARHLPQHGFRVRLFSEKTNQLSNEVCRQLKIREVTHMTTPLLYRIVLRILEAELEQDRPALIHVQSRRMLKAASWLSARLKIPYIVTMHDYLGERESLKLHSQWGRKVIAVSDSVRNDLLERSGIAPDRVQMIRGGVDLEGGVPCEPIMQDERRFVIGTAGALEQLKGIHYFLGAAKQVLIEFPETQFLISGSGPEEKQLRELSRSLGIEPSVTFIPSLGDFSGAISAMDVFCLPSLKQGLGTIMLEAMVRGRPVIATKTGGVYSVVKDRENGLVVPPGDVTALANRIIELLRKPEWARELGEAGRELVRKEYSVQQMIEQTAELYRELLKPNEPIRELTAAMEQHT